MRNIFNLILVLISIPVVHASEPSASVPISLKQTMLRVLEHNPQIKAHDYTAQMAAARIRQAQFSKPFNLNLEVNNFSGSGVYTGSEAMETTLSFAKILEFGNKVERRSDIATHEASLLRTDQDVQRLDILAEAARRFIHVVIDQKRLEIARDKLELVKRTYQVVEKRVRAGRSPVAERRRLSIARARADIEKEHAEHELATSQVKLSSMWGSTQPDFSSARTKLFNLSKVASFDQLKQLLEQNPDLIRFATTKRLAESRIKLARATSRANVEISAGIRQFNRSDDKAFVFSASIPLGTGSRAAPIITEAKLHLVQEPLKYRQQYLELHSSLFQFYQELLHARTAFNALSRQIIPEARKALRDYEKGYAAGRYSLLELTEAQRILLDARLELIITAANYHRYRIEIERLTGAAMRTGVSK